MLYSLIIICCARKAGHHSIIIFYGPSCSFVAKGQSSGLVQIAGVKVTPENAVKLCTFACRG
jgi:hypothetical protein